MLIGHLRRKCLIAEPDDGVAILFSARDSSDTVRAISRGQLEVFVK